MGKGISLRTFAERVDGQLSVEVRVTSGVPQGCLLRPLFLACVNIWRNSESNTRLFADNCIIYRKITDSSDTDKLQTALTDYGNGR